MLQGTPSYSGRNKLWQWLLIMESSQVRVNMTQVPCSVFSRAIRAGLTLRWKNVQQNDASWDVDSADAGRMNCWTDVWQYHGYILNQHYLWWPKIFPQNNFQLIWPWTTKCMLLKGIDEHSFSLKVSQADPRAKCSDIGKQILKKRIQHQHEMAIRHISVINYILQINFPL